MDRQDAVALDWMAEYVDRNVNPKSALPLQNTPPVVWTGAVAAQRSGTLRDRIVTISPFRYSVISINITSRGSISRGKEIGVLLINSCASFTSFSMQL